MSDIERLLESTFENIEQIGVGGGGTVFKAHHKRLDKDVVLKKIHFSIAKGIDCRNELNILKNLKHPYIPQVFDFIESGDDVYTVMEYIPGKSFAELLKQEAHFKQRDIIKWMRELCEVVHYLHCQPIPIIHCDIKPANIMLMPNGNICLIDFNISGIKNENELETLGYSNGYAPVEQFAIVSNRYIGKNNILKQSVQVSDVTEISTEQDLTEIDPDTTIFEKSTMKGENSIPSSNEISLMKSLNDMEWKKARYLTETIKEKLVIDERTDVYSIGATFYHIVTGTKPLPFFEEYIPVERRKSDVSQGLAYVINRAMKCLPSERFQSSVQLLKSVQKIETYDKRYKRLVKTQALLMLCVFVLSLGTILLVFAGKNQIEIEKDTAYAACISKMAECRENSNYDEMVAQFDRAIALKPEDQDAYFEMAMSYYQKKEYENCISFINKNVFSNVMLIHDAAYGRFYAIVGNCYFEMLEYKEAAINYERAVKLQSKEISYYRDYVVALVMGEQVDEAETVLKEAVEKGLSADILSLLQGEIATAKGKYEEAEIGFRDCIETTQDSYNLLRAYSKLDEILQMKYEGEEQYEKRIPLLTEALERLPDDAEILLVERLAQVYIDYGDLTGEKEYNNKAILLFEQNEERGIATFMNSYNIAVLYEKNGDYKAAEEKLRQMLNIYADNYVLYKRLAYVELNKQNESNLADRDYHTFEKEYLIAMELYRENSVGEDMEMILLEQLYQDVVANGWL